MVLSDGNHHMALAECVEAFVRRSPGLHEVFYTTTPPSVYLAWMRTGELNLGNLTLWVHRRGDRAEVRGRAAARGRGDGGAGGVRAKPGERVPGAGGESEGDSGRGGSAPAGRDSVHLESDTEAASLRRVPETMLAMARIQGLDVGALERRLSGGGRCGGEGGAIVFGERIHHREAPQALADGKADVAMVYYHLALRYVRCFRGSSRSCARVDPEGRGCGGG